jgi:hypothetical protein
LERSLITPEQTRQQKEFLTEISRADEELIATQRSSIDRLAPLEPSWN